MNDIHKYPFVRILMAFSLGIVASYYLSPSGSSLLGIILLLTVICFAVAVVLHHYANVRNRMKFGVFIFLTLFLMGFLWHAIYISHQFHHHFQDYIEKGKASSFVVELMEKPIEKENSYKAIVNVKYVVENQRIISSKGKALVYFEKEGFSEDLQYGDVLIFSGKAFRLESPKNPSMFDYKDYLNRHFIYHYFYLNKESYKITPKRYFHLKALAQQLRWKILKKFKEKGLEKNQLALLSALVFGYNEYLTEEVRFSFSNAGAMHILCVSGLHVGIIYAVILLLLAKIIPIKKKWYKQLSLIFVILFIWGFAFVSGLGDATVRATIMFTLLAVGKLLNKRYVSFNILAFSAFIMLLFNPNSITYLSFQLSYIAVFGILWLYPYINNWWIPQVKILKYIWSMSAVSIAAQVVLFPILIFYFHKISVLFLITNLFAIPLATMILYGALAFIVIYKIQFLSTFLINLLSVLLTLLERLTSFIGGFSFSYIDKIWINHWELAILYVVILLSIRYILIHKKYILPGILALTLIFFIIASNHRMKAVMYERMVLHQVKEGLAISFVNNNNSVFLADSAVLNQEKVIHYQIANFWDSYFMQPEHVNLQVEKHFQNSYLNVKHPFLLFLDKQILIIDDAWEYPSVLLNRDVNIDFLIINTLKLRNVYPILSELNVKAKAIITGKAPKYKANLLLDSLQKYHIPSYYTAVQGAFIYDVE